MNKEEKLDLANIIRKKIELAGQRGQKEQYHVDGEYGDHGWMHYTKGIRDACWAVDEVIAEAVEPILSNYIALGTNRKCSKCNRYIFPAGRYCPHCGMPVRWEDD